MAEVRQEWDLAAQRLTRRGAPDLQGALDVLLAIPWPRPSISKEDVGAMLALVADAWRVGEVPGQASRVCTLVARFADKGQVAFTSQQLDAVLYLLGGLIRARDPFIALGALRALVVVLADSGGRSKAAEMLYEGLMPRCRYPAAASAMTTQDADLQRTATAALGNLFVKPSVKLVPHAAATFDLLHQNFLRASEEAKRDPAGAKLLAATLRALQQLIAEVSGAKNAPVLPALQLHFAEFVNQLRALTFFGTALAPVTWHADESGKTTTTRRRANSAADTQSDSSADEASGRAATTATATAATAAAGEVTSTGWKVRANALGCVQALARSCPKQLYNHWPVLLPTSDTYSSSTPASSPLPSSNPPSLPSPTPTPPVSLASATLFTVLQFDDTSKVRAACLSALIALLDNSRTFWLAADETAAGRHTGPRTFVSYAATLVSIIRAMHSGLWRLLDTEPSTACLCLALKALALLAANAPYERLGAGLVAATATRLLGTGPGTGLIDHAHISVRVAALSCLSALLLTRSPLPEVASLTRDLGFVQRLLLLCNDPHPTVRAEALSCLAALARHYFDVLWPQCNRGLIQAVLLPALFFPTEPSLRHAAARVIEEAAAAAASATPESEQLAFWREILESRWSSALDDATHPVRCSVCATFASLSAGVYTALPRPLQVQCLTLILSKAAVDSVASVRAAAARALGTIVLFPGLKDDPVFISDAAMQLLTSLNEDQNLNVKVRASWALANLSDALVSEKESEQGIDMEEELAADVLKQLLESCLRAATEHDKIRANAVRALGNIARFASPKFLLPYFNQLLANLIMNLNQGSAKVRWNACYALGNALRNTALIDAAPKQDWTNTVLSALSDVLAEGKNFKIRINAAIALACPSQRARYPPPCFVRVMQTVLTALCNIDRVADVTEFQYKQTLMTQLIATLTHLLQLATDADITAMAPALRQEQAALLQVLDREDTRLGKSGRQGALWSKLAAVYAAIGSPLPECT